MSKEAALAAATSIVGPTGTAAAAPSTPTPEATTVPANLAKKEAEIVRQQMELKKERETFGTEKQKVQEILKAANEFDALRKNDPVAALKKLGYTETEIFNWMAAQEKTELTAEEKAIAAAKEAAAAEIKAFKDADTLEKQKAQEQLDQKTLGSFKSGISSLIKANPIKFEYCAYEGAAAEALIYETVLQSVVASKGKDVISAQEATELAEAYYEEKDKGMAALTKRKPAVSETDTKKEPERTRTVDPNSPGAATAKATVQRNRSINNGARATVASTTAKKPETPTEKRARLENMLRNGGKSA